VILGPLSARWSRRAAGGVRPLLWLVLAAAFPGGPADGPRADQNL
jgi:hypothetical protein